MNMQNFSSTQQVKVIAQVLNKMAKFFNQMTQQCLIQLSDDQTIKYKHRVLLNKENIKNYQNSKKLQKLKLKEKQQQRLKKKQNALQKIKNLKPKHPVSSFFFFYREEGQKIAKQKGQVLGSKIAKIVGQLWKNMSQQQREPYEKKARQTRNKYEQQMTQYKFKYGDEIANYKRYKKQIKLKKKHLQQKNNTQLKKQESLKKQQINEDPKGEQQNHEVQEANSYISSAQESLMQISDGLSDSLQLKSSQQQNSKSYQSDLDQIEPQIKQMMFDQHIKQQRSDQQVNKISESSQKQITKKDKNDDIQNKPKQQKIKKAIVQKDKKLLQTKTQQKKEINEKQSSANKQLKKQDQKSNNSQSQINFKQNQIDLPILQNTQSKTQINYQNIKRPKGPISSFFIFYRSQGKKISQQYDMPLGPKVIRLASQIWKKMPKEEKTVYQQQSKLTRDNYYSKMQQVKQTYGEDVFQRMKNARGANKQAKSKKARGKKARL